MTWCLGFKKKNYRRLTTNMQLARENYEKMLLYNEFITLSPDKILELGLAELKKEQERFNHAAHIIDPNKHPLMFIIQSRKPSIQLQKVLFPMLKSTWKWCGNS
jgi:hypothetical protein